MRSLTRPGDHQGQNYDNSARDQLLAKLQSRQNKAVIASSQPPVNSIIIQTLWRAAWSSHPRKSRVASIQYTEGSGLR